MGNTKSVDNEEAQQRLTLGIFAHFLSEAQVRKGRHYIVRHAAIGSACIILLLAFVWIGGNLFGFRYKVQDTVVSARTSDGKLSHIIQDKISTYKLTIVQPDGKRQGYSLQDIGLQVDVDNSIAIARAQQHHFGSRLQWWRPIPLRLTTTIDGNTLKAFMRNHAMIEVQPARDASLSFVDGTPKITEGATGKQYGFANPTHSILEAASALQTEPLRMRMVVKQPLVTAENLSKTKDKLNAIINQPVVLDVDKETIKPGADEIARWITYTAESPGKDADISVNTDEIQSYINGVAADHTHPPRAEVSLGPGGVIPGSDGIAVTNKDEVADAIARDLLAAKGVHLGIAVQRTPFKTITASAVGKWIEVDLTNKRMYVYNQTDLVKTLLVSAGASATPTVTGTYTIYSKFAKQTMSGPNSDGSHYVQPNVPWVNYFYQDYAIHGNYWRPTSYFGRINSSHGCVGLTTADAAWVYAWAPIGTPVVIHY